MALVVVADGLCARLVENPWQVSDRSLLSTCTELLCSPVFVELEPIEPKLRPECINETVQDVRGLIGI